MVTIEIQNPNPDVLFYKDTNEYVLDFGQSKKGVQKEAYFNFEGSGLVRYSVSCGCTTVSNVTSNSFSVNYDRTRVGKINQMVTLTFKNEEVIKIRLKGTVTE